jgi:hypothetical protein
MAIASNSTASFGVTLSSDIAVGPQFDAASSAGTLRSYSAQTPELLGFMTLPGTHAISTSSSVDQLASLIGKTTAAPTSTPADHLMSQEFGSHGLSYRSRSFANSVEFDPANVAATFDESDLPIGDELVELLASSIRRNLDQR